MKAGHKTLLHFVVKIHYFTGWIVVLQGNSVPFTSLSLDYGHNMIKHH